MLAEAIQDEAARPPMLDEAVHDEAARPPMLDEAVQDEAARLPMLDEAMLMRPRGLKCCVKSKSSKSDDNGYGDS